MTKPNCQEIWNGELGHPIKREDDGSWRHGVYRTDVYRRETDNTYWQVFYRVSMDGETNELREGYASIDQVVPREITTIIFESAEG